MLVAGRIPMVKNLKDHRLGSNGVRYPEALRLYSKLPATQPLKADDACHAFAACSLSQASL